jgi:hypothetical protein
MAKNDVNDTFTKKFADAKFNENEKFIVDNLMYEIIAGSRAYGVENEDSDYDVVAIFMNKHSDLYPQNYGFIMGFDTETGKFDNKECKGVGNRLMHKGVDLEAEWRSLTNFAYLAAMKGSPNIVESLFVRQQNIKYIHPAFVPIKDNAPKFITMKSFHAFNGYMHSQFHRVKANVDRGITDNPKRQWMLEKYGYDVKMSYHIVRLIDILMQMLDGETHIDLMRNKEACKAMRNGDWGSWDDFQKYTTEKFAFLDLKAGDCKLPVRPRTTEVRNIINSSIESWYGSNEGQHVQNREYISADDIKAQLDRIENSIKGINVI